MSVMSLFKGRVESRHARKIEEVLEEGRPSVDILSRGQKQSQKTYQSHSHDRTSVLGLLGDQAVGVPILSRLGEEALLEELGSRLSFLQSLLVVGLMKALVRQLRSRCPRDLKEGRTSSLIRRMMSG